jgi:hypothetical protein
VGINLDFLDRLFGGSKLTRRQLAQAKPQGPRILVNWFNVRSEWKDWNNPTDDEVADAIRRVTPHYADGNQYVDKRQPNLVADQSAMTPTTTMKNIWANGATNPCILPANYWWVGKTLRLTANLKLTTGTAGNSVFEQAYGSTDAPAALSLTRTSAKVASVGPFGIFMQGYSTCRTTGTSGTLSQWGMVFPSLDVFLSTVQPMPFPNAGSTVTSTIDTTVGTNGLSFQYQTSAGTDSILATDIILEALN